MKRRQFLQTGATATAALTTPAFINLGPLGGPETFTSAAVSDDVEFPTDGPSFVVRYDDGERDHLVSDLDLSDDQILRELSSLNMLVVEVPWETAGRTSILGFHRFTGGFEGLDYVSLADANAVLSRPEPVESLDEMDAVSFDDADIGFQDWISLGIRSLSASPAPSLDGLAFDTDAPETSLADARGHVNADDTLVDSIDTSGVTVAVIDTGVNTSDDLAEGRLHDESTGLAKSGDPNVSGDGTSAVADGDGHGTWVAHCIAGADGFAPDATVLGLKSLADDGSGSTADIVAGVEKAIDVGADVACMSLGSPMWSQALADTLEDAYNAGIFCVVAAGNDRYGSIWVASPADASAGYPVNATNVPESGNRDDTKLAYFGNIGPDPGVPDASDGESEGSVPKLAAPGMNVTVEPTGTLSGTSMAAPMVSGGAALLSSEGYNAEDIWDRLSRYAYPIPNAGTTETENGLLDVQAAIDGTESDESQSDVLSNEATARDAFNERLSDSQGGFLAGLF